MTELQTELMIKLGILVDAAQATGMPVDDFIEVFDNFLMLAHVARGLADD